MLNYHPDEWGLEVEAKDPRSDSEGTLVLGTFFFFKMRIETNFPSKFLSKSLPNIHTNLPKKKYSSVEIIFFEKEH